MKLYITRSKSNIDAVMEWEQVSGTFTVLKGSKVSLSITQTGTFRGINALARQREQYVKDGRVISDVIFKSASSAANFVTGISTNGLMAWKNENGERLKDFIDKTDSTL